VLAAVVLIAWLGEPSGYRVTQSAHDQIPQAENQDVTNPVAAPREFEPWSDTYAQWLMALFSVVATFVSIWAVRLLRDTLGATRDAVRAADDAVKVTREMGEAQVRAYVSINKLSIYEFTESGFKVGLEVNNFGASPAKEFRIWAQIFFRQNPDIDEIKFTINRRQSLTVIGAGMPYRVSWGQRLPVHITKDLILQRALYIVVAGKFSYRDVFGKRRRGTFRYFLDPDNLNESGVGGSRERQQAQQ